MFLGLCAAATASAASHWEMRDVLELYNRHWVGLATSCWEWDACKFVFIVDIISLALTWRQQLRDHHPQSRQQRGYNFTLLYNQSDSNFITAQRYTSAVGLYAVVVCLYVRLSYFDAIWSILREAPLRGPSALADNRVGSSFNMRVTLSLLAGDTR